MTDDVKAVAQRILDRAADQIGTHSTNCHEYHLPCFAAFVARQLEAATSAPAVDREALANGLRRRFGVSNGTQTWVEFQGTADGLSQVVVDMLGARDVRQVQAEALEQAADAVPNVTVIDEAVKRWLRARAQAIREARSER